jgi:hypothetical protein
MLAPKDLTLIASPCLAVIVIEDPYSKIELQSPSASPVEPDKTKVKGRSVVITGDTNSIGEVIVREFVATVAFVTFGDLHPPRGDLEKELNSNGDNDYYVCEI